MEKKVRLGGRVFEPTLEEDITFDQFAWIQTAAEKAGLGKELRKRLEPIVVAAAGHDPTAISDLDAEELGTSIVYRCYEERAHLDVLAGMLVEVGKEWKYENAVQNREFFGGLKGKDEIETVQLLLSQLVLAFFWSGLDSMVTSPKSSDPKAGLSALGAMGMTTMEDESVQEGDSENSER